MDRWRQTLLLGRLVLWCAMFWFIFDGLPYIAAWRQRMSGPAPRNAAQPAPAAQGLSIVSFTLTPAAIQPGASANLCYEVLNAASFSLDPPHPAFTHAPNACLPVSPAATTRYTLTASGARRSKVSRSLLLTVQPASAAR